MRMDLSSFEGSFGVEKNLHSLFPPPPVLKKLPQETFCRLELCTLLFWRASVAQDTQCWGWMEAGAARGGKGEESSWPGLSPSRLSPCSLSEEAHFADVLGV